MQSSPQQVRKISSPPQNCLVRKILVRSASHRPVHEIDTAHFDAFLVDLMVTVRLRRNLGSLLHSTGAKKPNETT